MGAKILAEQFLYPKEYKEQRLEQYKLNKVIPKIKINDVELSAFNLEVSFKASEEPQYPLIKVIVDFNFNEIFNIIEANEIVKINLTIFGEETELLFPLKNSNTRVSAYKGPTTCRMIFKNR